MRWLKAELEIRGLEKCAKKPERCKGEIKKVLEDCKRGECFVDPEKVIKEGEEVLSKRREITLTHVVVFALVVLLVVNLIGTYLFYMKLNEALKQVAELKKEVDNLKWSVRTSAFRLNNLEVRLNNLVREIRTISENIEAMKVAIFYLNGR